MPIKFLRFDVFILILLFLLFIQRTLTDGNDRKGAFFHKSPHPYQYQSKNQYIFIIYTAKIFQKKPLNPPLAGVLMGGATSWKYY